ncbi:MAG: AGE family epimerase/isomerase, partial [Planctomycetales bacterium]|nr:AGE family epimerase/isomerase [Planctomycetales bacterium]
MAQHTEQGNHRWDLTASEQQYLLRELLPVYRDGLLQDTLNFWLPRCLDTEFGGYATAVDSDGRLVDTDKSVWQQGRFAWLLSKMFNTVHRNDAWLESAKLGIDFLDRCCFDARDGRMWFQVTREGRPIRKRRYAFSESFASIAYGQFAMATGQAIYADKAIRTFERFVQHNQDPSCSEPKYERERRGRSIGFPMICIGVAQELRESIGMDTANTWIDQSIAAIEADFVRHDLQVVLETVGPDGEILDHFDGRTLNPGHAMEAAWFIMSEGKFRGDDRLVQLGTEMLRWMWQRGWDPQFGGILYFVDLYGGPVQEYWHDMKFWWPHNEAIIATLMAYLLTQDASFLDWHKQVHQWAHRHFADPQHGEWFGYLHRDGTLSST